MPKKLLLIGKHTLIFRGWDCYGVYLFGYMPKIHILVDTAKTLKQYDAASVVNWMSRQLDALNVADKFAPDKSDFQPATDFTIFGYVSCVAKNYKLFGNLKCEITNLSIVFPCVDCKNAYFEYELISENLTRDFIKFIDKKYKPLLSKKYMESPSQVGNRLIELMSYFTIEKQAAILSPLKYFHVIKSKYSDKLQLLAFGYASIFKDLLGNATLSRAKILENNSNAVTTVCLFLLYPRIRF